MKRAKSKARLPNSEVNDEPYHHPVLEEQLVIRFPPDIAVKLENQMQDDCFKDFEIVFTDQRNATVKVFDEVLCARLVNLPTIIETYRTVDMSHLYKSADIGEMLIVYRQNSSPPDLPEGDNNDYEHGLTPPTRDIVTKRKLKLEHAKRQQAEQYGSLEGIEYWEMVEIQLAKLLSKDGNTKTIYRHEFMEEPDVDPVLLEKALRRAGRKEFVGYSGRHIPESEIEEIDEEGDPAIIVPPAVLNKQLEGPGDHKGDEEEDVGDFDFEFDNLPQEDEKTEPEPAEESQTVKSEPAKEEEEEEDEYDSASDEHDDEDEKLEIQRNIRAYENNIEQNLKKLQDPALNDIAKRKINSFIDQYRKQLDALKEQLKALEEDS